MQTTTTINTNTNTSTAMELRRPDFKEHEVHVKMPSSWSLSTNSNREVDSAPQVAMSFLVHGEFHNMLREPQEIMEKCLKRFAKNITTKLMKQHQAHQKKDKKKQKQNHSPTPKESESPVLPVEESDEVFVMFREERVNLSALTNLEFQTDMIIHIRNPLHHPEYQNNHVHDEVGQNHLPEKTQAYLQYRVVRNAPVVVSINTFPRSHFTVHCPIVPNVKTEYADDYCVLWYRESSPGNKEYVHVSNQKIFIPTREMIGCAIKIYVYAIRYDSTNPDQHIVAEKGRAFAHYLTHYVQDYANTPSHKDVQQIHGNNMLNKVVHLRDEYFQQSSKYQRVALSSKLFDNEAEDNFEFKELLHQVYNHQSVANSQKSLRIMCYNILSDGYALQEREKMSANAKGEPINGMYYYMSNVHHLAVDYRLQRVVFELLHTQADVICLQECDRKVFDHYLNPLLGYYGYEGHYTNKISMVLEGCVTFYKLTSVRPLLNVDLAIKTVYRNDALLHKTLFTLRPDLIDILGGKLGTVGQISVALYEDTILIVGNTHLFYHPLATYLRLLQIRAIVERMNRLYLDLVQLVQFEGRKSISKQELLSFLSKDLDEDITLETRQLEQESRTTLFEPITASNVDDDQEMIELDKVKRIGSAIMGDLNSTPLTPSIEYLTK